MDYLKHAQNFAQSVGLTMKVKYDGYDTMPYWNDDTKRHIFKITLKRKGKQYTFYFGQSIASGSQEPTLYDVLACLQKYDVGTFGDFCNCYGYEFYTEMERRKVQRIYKAVCKEYEAVYTLFNDVMDELMEIE